MLPNRPLIINTETPRSRCVLQLLPRGAKSRRDPTRSSPAPRVENCELWRTELMITRKARETSKREFGKRANYTCLRHQPRSYRIHVLLKWVHGSGLRVRVSTKLRARPLPFDGARAILSGEGGDKAKSCRRFSRLQYNSSFIIPIYTSWLRPRLRHHPPRRDSYLVDLTYLCSVFRLPNPRIYLLYMHAEFNYTAASMSSTCEQYAKYENIRQQSFGYHLSPSKIRTFAYSL